MTRTSTYVLFALAAAVALAITAVTVAPAVTSAGGNKGNSGKLDPDDFSTTIDNPFFPLSSLGPKVLEGPETDPDTGITVTARLESTVLDKTRKVAGIEVLVLEEIAYEDGEVIEVALDFFAQHEDGAVYYFGEKVDNYVDGKIDNHDGSWLAGKNGAQPGIVMPAQPVVGQTFKQENAPGVAEDQVTILALNESVSTPAGNFSGCLKAEDSSPLNPGVIDIKFYCPGVGQVREAGLDGFIELISYSTTAEGGAGDSAGPAADATEGPQPSPTVAANEDDAGDADAAAGALSQPVATVNGDAGEDEDADDDDESAAPGTLVEGAELLPQAAITLEQAIAAAQAEVQGDLGTVELEEDDGSLVFIVEIGDEEVKVDAQTGQVITEDEEDEGQSEDEGSVSDD